MLLWWLILALLVIKFYLDNGATVDVVFYQATLRDVAVSQLAFSLVGAGMALAVLLLLPWVLLWRLRLIRLEKQLKRTKTALQAVEKS
jgi:uncharacterized membrane protein YciS (DUF1049 family)